jgi:perosamine synthetase
MSASSIDLFHSVHLPEMESAALDVLRSGQIASGPKIQELERTLTSVLGTEHLVSTNNLTSAILLALHLAGVREGDEVATLAFSCLQSNAPIAHLGARPIWVDVDPSTMSMSPSDLAAKITPFVKAVMVYHIAGYPADTTQIAAICRARGIPLIEDCNNSIGATLNGQPLGIAGDFAVYSLYPNRQINGSEGGILSTPDTTTASHAMRLRRFGIDTQSFRDNRGEINPASDVGKIGWSAALNQLNAAIALAQLSSLKSRLARTQILAARLTQRLQGLKELHPVQPLAGGIPAFWGLFVRSAQRDALLAHLKAHGINASIIHQRNDWYTGFGTPRGNLIGTAVVMNEMLALPCGWWLTDAQIDTLVDRVCEFCQK